MALITYLTRIQFDFGALKLLEAELQLLGIRRPARREVAAIDAAPNRETRENRGRNEC